MGIVGYKDLAILFLAFVVSWFSSYTAMDILNRITPVATWRPRYTWLFLSAMTMGLGIWAMHFISMISYNYDFIVNYDVETTIYSAIVPIVGTGVAFYITLGATNYYRLMLASTLIGISIAFMHYLGMSAMRMPMTISYSYWLVGMSVIIAIGFSLIAVWYGSRTINPINRLISSMFMAFAVCGMHYTGMVATSFKPIDMQHQGDAGTYQINIAITVGIITGVILLSSLILSIFDRKFAFMAEASAQKLVESERRYRNLYRETPLPIHIIDKHSVIQDVSNSWLQLLEYTRNEVIGHKFTQFMTDESIIAYNTRLAGVIPSYLNEYQLITRDKKTIDVLLSSNFQRDNNGSISGAIEGIVNITNRKAAEIALRQKQKMEALGELIGGVSHDFNNLLMVISGNIDMLTLNRDKTEDRLINIKSTITKGQQLTRKLLEFSKPDKDTKSFIDSRIFFSDIQDTLQRALGTEVQISIDVKADVNLIEVDLEELELTVLNLCINARDAIQDRGYIHIKVSNAFLPNDRVKNLHGSFVCISVTDNGAGIKHEDIPRIFDPLYTTKNKEFGTGLGLSQVYAFITIKNNGMVTVDSNLGSGTTVSIYLPSVITSQNIEIYKNTDTKLVDGEQRAVLIVEDDKMVSEVIDSLFRQLNFSTTVVHDASQALYILETKKIFAMFTDVMMPGSMNGVQLAQQARSLYPNMFIALVTGYNDPSDELMAAPFPKLKKPFTITSLQLFVNIALK